MLYLLGICVVVTLKVIMGYIINHRFFLLSDWECCESLNGRYTEDT